MLLGLSGNVFWGGEWMRAGAGVYLQGEGLGGSRVGRDRAPSRGPAESITFLKLKLKGSPISLNFSKNS